LATKNKKTERELTGRHKNKQPLEGKYKLRQKGFLPMCKDAEKGTEGVGTSEAGPM